MFAHNWQAQATYIGPILKVTYQGQHAVNDFVNRAYALFALKASLQTSTFTAARGDV